MTPAEQCAICGPSKHELRLRIQQLESETCRMRAALEEIMNMDFGLDAKGTRDLYTGPSRFVSAWLTAEKGLVGSAAAPCPHEAEVNRLRALFKEIKQIINPGIYCGQDYTGHLFQIAQITIAALAEGRKA